MNPLPAFLFVTCQVGAERAVKSELARLWPEFRFAYSRPGFLTFKLPLGHNLPADFQLKSVFARSYAFSLGKVTDPDPVRRAEAVWQLAGDTNYDRLHVWPRDRYAAGEHDFEPGLNDDSDQAEQLLRDARTRLQPEAPPLSETSLARDGQRILDCVLVEPEQWWVGFHVARGYASRRPGGLERIPLPEDAVSRAYLKMEESLRWSRLPIRSGEHCAEIGCAPGGSCQVLLRHGLWVMGIDPASIAPAVLEHPRFTHVRKRGGEVRLKEFRSLRWLMADMNVTPEETLATVERIVKHPEVSIRGMLLTLKFADWELAEQVPQFLERIRAWGYPLVRARQLQHNRREICVAAMKKSAIRRPISGAKKKKREV